MNLVKDILGGVQSPWMSGTVLLKYVLYIEELWKLLLIIPFEQIYFGVSVKMNAFIHHCFILETLCSF